MQRVINSHWVLMEMEEDIILLPSFSLHHSLVYLFHLRHLRYFELFSSSVSSRYKLYSEIFIFLSGKLVARGICIDFDHRVLIV